MLQVEMRLSPDESGCAEEYGRFRNLLAALHQVWTEFQTGGDVPDGLIKPEVLTSWRRCRARGMDPRQSLPLASPLLPAAELGARHQASIQLIEQVGPFLQTFANSIKGSGFRIDLLDRDLYILMQYGEECPVTAAATLGWGPGAHRSEQRIGTNAANLAAHLQKPVQLTGPEHFNANLHEWTCSAVPIFSPGRDFLGVVNIAGHISLFHQHTLGMAIAPFQQWDKYEIVR